MKIALTMVTILLSMNSFAAHYKTCDWNGNKRQFVVPENETVELLRESFKTKISRAEKIKEIKEIVLMEEQGKSVASPSVCDLVSKTYRVSQEKCIKAFDSEGFLYLMDAYPAAVKTSELSCKVGLNIRLLFY